MRSFSLNQIQYCSDLHLEFPENRKYIRKYPLPSNADVLILAGDIVPFNSMEDHDDFFDYLSDHFKFTYWIPGNHEYYHSDASIRSGRVNEKIRENVFLVNNISVRLEDVNFIFSTLWSYISTPNERAIENSLNDFHLVRYKDRFFSAADVNRFHVDSLAFIEEELSKEHNARTVVATHHVPTFMNYPPRYRNSNLNEAFAVELFPLIEKSKIDYWIYGHHHYNCPPFTIGNTTLVTNQLGYVKQGEHRKFDGGKVIGGSPNLLQ